MEYLAIILPIVFVILALLAVFYIRKTKQAKENEQRDEIGKEAENEIGKILDTLPGKRLSNKIFLDKNYSSHEIDHLFICRRGIFVIESKTFAGEIIGDPSQEKLMFKLYDGHILERRNPIKQNDTHVRVVKEVIGKKNHPFNLVVFVKGDISKINDPRLISIEQLKEFILSQPEIYSDLQVEVFFDMLARNADNGISHEDHVKALKKKHKDAN